MIIGAHVIITSKNAEADRAFLKGLTLPSVPMPDGFTIYGLPPSEVAIHPSDKNDVHEFYLMCDDVDATIAAMEKKGIATSPIREAGWGRLTTLTLPGGGKLGIYEPLHPRPKQQLPKARPEEEGKTRATEEGARQDVRKTHAKAPLTPFVSWPAGVRATQLEKRAGLTNPAALILSLKTTASPGWPALPRATTCSASAASFRLRRSR